MSNLVARQFLYSVRQLRQIEQQALLRQPLMPVAGLAAATVAMKLLDGATQPVLVLAGPGNNGGDGFEVAAHLADAGHAVDIMECANGSTGTSHSSSSSNSSHSANATERALARAKAAAKTTVRWLAVGQLPRRDYALVIDALFGIGLSKPLPSDLCQVVDAVNTMSCPILALDVPSGLDADRGTVIGTTAIRATHTITFIGDKPGLHTCDGRDQAGQVQCDHLGIDPALLSDTSMELNQPGLFPLIFKRRQQNTNKGTNGSVQLIGGAAGMRGALVLASRAALFCGAGKVLAGFVDGGVELDSLHPEIMIRHAAQLLNDAEIACRVIGTGMGKSTTSFDLLTKALLATTPTVIDADALTLLAEQPALKALCNGRTEATTVLTPHPLEAARLLACDVKQVQADRIDAAKTLARRFSSIIILKGSGTVIACPKGRVVINSTGNPGLATGGTGDVLSGTCGALVAQHHDMWQCALAATWLHGLAADDLVAAGIGPVGLTAGELIPAIRRRLN